MYVQVNHFAVHQLKLTLFKQLYFNLKKKKSNGIY